MNYEINEETMIISPINDEKCRVLESDAEYVVNGTPLNVIERSCEYFGSSFVGRQTGAIKLIGAEYKIPILIEETRNIVFFPTTSPNNSDCTWISLNNIKKYEKTSDKRYTKVIFKNGDEVEISISYGSFNNQILRASRLKTVLLDRIK